MDAKPKRRWYQFSLRTLFVAMVAVAIFSAVCAKMMAMDMAHMNRGYSIWPLIFELLILFSPMLLPFVAAVVYVVVTRRVPPLAPLVFFAAEVIGFGITVLIFKSWQS